MSSSFPADVLRQAQLDAEVGRRLNPDRNIIQRSQDFLRDQLNKFVGNPVKGARTPQQQADFDAEVGRRLMKQQKLQQKFNIKDAARTSGIVSGLISPGSIVTTLATTLTSDSDQTNKWKRLGYPSAEAYNQAMQKVRDKGIDLETGKKLTANKRGLTKLSDGSLRTGGGDVYSADGKRYTTSGGIIYDLETGQAVNPATNTISETGYSIDPSTGKGSDNDRTNANGIEQKGRNFDSMAENIFKAMAERNANTGVAASTLAAINSMNPVSKYSSTNLPTTDTNIFTNTEGSINSFENSGIAVNTGAVQPRDPNVNFSSAYARQFERPVDMPSVATTPGVKNPVEYTNYMTSDLALGSMDALRMNEIQKGLIYASGQYWGKGADGKAVKVDRDLARKVKRGAEGADELLANFLGRGTFVEADAGYTAADYNSQGQLLNDRNLLTFKDGSQRYLSDIPEDEDLSATY